MSSYEATLRDHFPGYFRTLFDLLGNEEQAALVAQQLCLESFRNQMRGNTPFESGYTS